MAGRWLGQPDSGLVDMCARTTRGLSRGTALFLNFGDKPRAEQFLHQRLDHSFEGTPMKAFDVPDSYADAIRDKVVPGLLDAIVPGSGRVVS